MKKFIQKFTVNLNSKKFKVIYLGDLSFLKNYYY